MIQRILISMAEVESQLQPRMAALRGTGIDARGLFAYSLHMARYGDFQTLKGHVAKDILEFHPELLQDPIRYQQTLHSCIDCIGDAASSLIPYIERVCGFCDHTVYFEQFIGQDAILSLRSSL